MIIALASAAAVASLPAGTRAAAPPSCAHAEELPEGSETLADARSALLCLINADRRAHHRRALLNDVHLHRAAQAYAAAIDPDAPLVHVGKDGRTLRARIVASRYAKRFLYAEALGRSRGRSATPDARVRGWLASGSTRSVLRSARFRDVGIGLARTGDKLTFVVVLAAKTQTSSRRTASAKAKRSSGSSRRAPKSSRS